MAQQHLSDTLVNPPGFKIDLEMLKQFEASLDPRQPERSGISAKVLGYGEISTVFEIRSAEMQGLAFKRLPIFLTPDELAAYRASYDEYNTLMQDKVGIRMAEHGYALFTSSSGRPLFYIIQRQEKAEAIGHRAMQKLNHADVLRLFEGLLRELRKVWDYNASQAKYQIAIDGQISNWVIDGFDAASGKLPEKLAFRYLDTSTPLYRIGGVEQLNPELFLRSAPSFLRWVLRLLFLEDVLNRYYDFHKVALDIIANFYKEQRPEYVPDLVQAANAYFAGEGAGLNIQPLSEKEVKAYYDEDRTIWSVYLTMRRLDRWLHGQIGKEYPYILPGPIKR